MISVLEKVLYRAKSYNLKLNFDKVRVRIQQVPYVGHIISAEGLQPHPKKVRAMKTPSLTTKEDVPMKKFLPMLGEVDTPLRELTKRDVLFHWDALQAEAFQRLKIYVAQPQYWHTTMLRKKQPYNVTLARMQSARSCCKKDDQ